MQNSTTTATTAPNTSTKSVLARLLATENISVEHSNVPTAAFDLKTRTLILPRWKDMSNALYDMLVGHEVSHALHTPQTGWSTDSKTLAAKHGVSEGVARQYLNIAEDARIERLIKNQFPGLRADFFKGYGELLAQDFFKTQGSDWNTLCCGDRVNLHFKLGLHTGASITFNAHEQGIVDALDAAQTWEHAVAAADAMLAVDAGKWMKEKQDSNSDQSDGASGSGEGEEQESQSQSGSGEGEAKSESGSTTTDGGDESESNGGSPEDSQGGDTGGNQPSNGNSQSTKPQSDMPMPTTQSAFENAMKTLNDTSRSGYDVKTMRVCDTQDAVVDFKSVLADVERIVARLNPVVEPFRSAEYKTASTAMATAFDRRKSADIWKRTVIAKTGGVDPLRMTQYKWNEDIFRRTARVTTGKNHGIVILLDWSGSMCTIMQQTLGQLIILTDFCRMAGIPFEVFAFTDSPYLKLEKGADPYSDDVYAQYKAQREAWEKPMIGKAATVQVSLLNFFSSRMTAPQYERMKSMLWRHWGTITNDRCYRMGSTPTVSALYHIVPVVENFLKANRIQIAHTVVLTDGEATDGFYTNTSGSGYRTHHVMQDPQTGVSYDIDTHYCTGADGKYGSFQRGTVRWENPYNASVCAAIDILRRRTGSKVHWIGLTERQSTNVPHMGGFVPSAKGNNWSRDGFARGTACGFDTAVVAVAARFGDAGNNAWIERQMHKMDEKIDAAKSARTLVTAVVNKQAMANSMRSLSTIIGEYLALA